MADDPIQILVRAALVESGLKQTAVAPRLGISRPALSDRLRGRTRFTTAELPAIASMLGMSLVDLLGDVVEPTHPERKTTTHV